MLRVDQAADKFVEAGLADPLRAFRRDDRSDASEAIVHLVVHQDIFLFGPVADLIRRPLHPVGDHF